MHSEQQYLTRVTGEFDAVIDFQLKQQALKTINDSEIRQLRLASELLSQDIQFFWQRYPQLNQVDYLKLPSGRVKDLASKDGVSGVIAKALIKALSGIPSSVANMAGAVGQEKIKRYLTTVSENIAYLAPTDLGSVAAGLLAVNIASRLKSKEVVLSKGLVELARLFATDGDYAGDLFSVVLGCSAGGGVLGILSFKN